MNTFDFVNEETGVPFRVRIVCRGETYGRGANLRKNDPLVSSMSEGILPILTKMDNLLRIILLGNFFARIPAG
jgi:hypothetical protein